MEHSQQLLDYNNNDLFPVVLLEGIKPSPEATSGGIPVINAGLAGSMTTKPAASIATEDVVINVRGEDTRLFCATMNLSALKGIYDPSTITDNGTYLYRYTKSSGGNQYGYINANTIEVGTCGEAYNMVKTVDGSKVRMEAGGSNTPVYFSNGIPVACTSYSNASVDKADYASKATYITDTSRNKSNIGNSTTPVYINNGVPSVCTSYSNASVASATTASNITGGAAWKIPFKDTNSNINWISAPTEDGTCLTAHLNGSTVQSLSWTKPAASVKSDPSTNIIYLIGQANASRTDELSQVYFNSQNYMKDGTFYQTSDESLKTKIDDIEIDFEKLKAITKFVFHWNYDENKKPQIGVTAQSLEKVYPELVSINPSTGLKSVSYEKLAVISLAAIDKLYDKQKELEERLIRLEETLSK